MVVGRWNPSILTPAGIAKRLFQLPENTPIEVSLAIDVMLPPVVTHDNLRVRCGHQTLIIEPLTNTYADLERARQLAQNALESLPETPVSAAGINVRYSYEDADESLTRVQEIITADLDGLISSLTHKITKRAVMRTMPILDGQLNLSVSEDEQGHVQLQFNFEYSSPEGTKQRGWLSKPIDDFKKEVRTIITKALEFNEELTPND